IQNILNDKIV
nr:neurotoxin type B Hn+ 35 kda subunit=band 3a [Clostridium botulinum, type B, Peptide Partial, 10 aa] [Clostridium botulinum]